MSLYGREYIAFGIPTIPTLPKKLRAEPYIYDGGSKHINTFVKLPGGFSALEDILKGKTKLTFSATQNVSINVYSPTPEGEIGQFTAIGAGSQSATRTHKLGQKPIANWQKYGFVGRGGTYFGFGWYQAAQFPESNVQKQDKSYFDVNVTYASAPPPAKPTNGPTPVVMELYAEKNQWTMDFFYAKDESGNIWASLMYSDFLFGSGYKHYTLGDPNLPGTGAAIALITGIESDWAFSQNGEFTTRGGGRKRYSLGVVGEFAGLPITAVVASSYFTSLGVGVHGLAECTVTGVSVSTTKDS